MGGEEQAHYWVYAFVYPHQCCEISALSTWLPVCVTLFGVTVLSCRMCVPLWSGGALKGIGLL